MERDNVGSAILIIRGDDMLSARFEVSTVMALIGAVNDATMGAESKFGVEGGPTVLVVDTFIVAKKDLGAESKFREEGGLTVLVVDTFIVAKKDHTLVVQ